VAQYALRRPSGPSTVFQVDPAGPTTTNQMLVANSGLISAPAGIGVAADGTLLTANVVGNSIIRINLTGWCSRRRPPGGGELTGAFGLAALAQPPKLTGAASRKVHGTAGTFNLPLAQ
jgi:hypothetical protein